MKRIMAVFAALILLAFAALAEAEGIRTTPAPAAANAPPYIHAQ